MTSWKENLLNRSELLQLAKDYAQKFRNDISAVPASSIAEQFYCEMKVEQEYVHGEIETETKEEGTALHENLLAMKKATIENIIKGIVKEKVFVASFPLMAKFEGLTLVGVPDVVVFEKSKPTYVIELKTTAKGDLTRIYDGQKAQALVYGLLLELIGFDCSNLKLIIVRYRSSSALSMKSKSKFHNLLISSLLAGTSDNFAIKSRNEIVVHSLSYGKHYAAEAIKQTKGYWLNEREPTPATNPNKCRACEFRDVCPSSLVRGRQS